MFLLVNALFSDLLFVCLGYLLASPCCILPSWSAIVLLGVLLFCSAHLLDFLDLSRSED